MKFTYIQRSITSRLIKLFQSFPCVVISGARQVGKSTLLQHTFPELRQVVFDPVVDVQNARQDPDLFLDNNPPPIILDEIQYAPELVPAIKRRLDKIQKPSLYLLTGSQQWSVLNQLCESLAGRAALLDLEGFSLAELGGKAQTKNWLTRWLKSPEDFVHESHHRLSLPYGLYDQLWRGFLPKTHFLDLDLIPDFHAAYQRTYIERDIRVLADVSDLQLFSRFIRLTAALTGQEINYSHLGREIGVTPQTAKRWLQILKHTFEWFEIPAYANNPIKKVSEKSKGYFSDVGQVCYSQMISSPLALPSHPLWGHIYENAVVSEIRKQCLTISTPPAMYHWRIYSGSECDIILERDGKFYPMEIKAKTRITRNDARGLSSFRENHKNLNIQKGLILAPTSDCFFVTKDDYVIPWDLE